MEAETQVKADKMILKDQIQHTQNRIEYDRTITPREREDLRKVLDSLERDYQEFFGKEVENGL